MKYADIVRLLAERTGVSMEDALKRFYESHEYQLLSRGVSDLHCMTPDYIVGDIIGEENTRHSTTTTFNCNQFSDNNPTERKKKET